MSSSRRVVLSCWGSYGDLFPYLGIAARLKALGHAPVVATAAFYRERVLGDGIEFHAVRPDVDPSNTALLDRVMSPARGTEVVVREMTAPAVRDAYADLTDVVGGADLVVTHPIAFAGPIAAARHGVRWLSTVLAPISMFSAHDFSVVPNARAMTWLARGRPWAARLMVRVGKRVTARWTAPVRALRRELGLADAGNPIFEGQFSPYGTLALFSPVIGAPQPDWPLHTTQTGFIFHEDETPLPADVAAFLDGGEPPIVFTLGTSAAGAAGSFYDESIAAARALGRRAILLVGRDPRNQSREPLPATMMAAEYAPHGVLFPRAAAIVHHGGIGTMARALRAGVPSLVVPHAHDQFDNAARAARIGVARVRNAKRYTGRAAAADLGALLADPRYATRAREIGQAVAAERGADAACETILRTIDG